MTTKSESDIVDSLIMQETSKVDWHQVPGNVAAGFGLSVGLFRDSVNVKQQRRIAWGTTIGGIVSMSVLAVTCMVTGTSGWFAVGLILIHQSLRSAFLFWKMKQSEKDMEELQEQAIDYAKHLAETYPDAINQLITEGETDVSTG